MIYRWVLVAATLGCAACHMEPAGPDVHENRAIDRDKAERVRVRLNMGAGELRVDSGSDKLATLDFTYNVPDFKPEVEYRNSSGNGELTVSEPNGTHINFHGNTKNEWNIRLSREVPLDITAHFGAGEAHLNLGALDLRNLEVEMGAGEADLDLRGNPKISYNVHMHGGVGEATIHVPSSVGVEAVATGGIGEITASGLHEDGHRYTNDALGKSPVTVRLDIQGGVGAIHLISGP
jgi:hypothetical protein